MTNIEELKNYGLDITEDMKQGILICDIYTVWCGPCKFLSPILEKLREEGLIKLVKVDLDQNRPLGERFGVTAIPTLLFFKDGEMVNGIIEIQGQPLVRDGIMIGAAGENVLKSIIAKI
ncbi:MAG: thioredoxin family protein [Candidatus Hermodarchaeota archaeon]